MRTAGKVGDGVGVHAGRLGLAGFRPVHIGPRRTVDRVRESLTGESCADRGAHAGCVGNVELGEVHRTERNAMRREQALPGTSQHAAGTDKQHRADGGRAGGGVCLWRLHVCDLPLNLALASLPASAVLSDVVDARTTAATGS